MLVMCLMMLHLVVLSSHLVFFLEWPKSLVVTQGLASVVGLHLVHIPITSWWELDPNVPSHCLFSSPLLLIWVHWAQGDSCCQVLNETYCLPIGVALFLLVHLLLQEVWPQHWLCGQEDNTLNTTGNLAAQFLKQRLKDEGMAYARPAFAAVLQPLDTAAFNNKCVLISACQSDEESFDFKEGSSYGTLSNAIQTILRQHRDPIDNFHLVLAVKTLLKNQGFPQHPGLYCGAKKADSVFICY